VRFSRRSGHGTDFGGADVRGADVRTGMPSRRTDLRASGVPVEWARPGRASTMAGALRMTGRSG